jgi:hypothetical protein
MILDYPLAYYRTAPVGVPMCKGLNVNGFLPVWVWLLGKSFKGYTMDGDRMSERFAGVTDCQSVSGTFLNCVRNTAAPRLQ